jgi:DNA repair protein RadC
MNEYEIFEMLKSIAKETKKICLPKDIAPMLMTKIGKKDVEHFIVVALDGSHCILGSKIISMGTLNRTIVHPRDIFRFAIAKNACSVIVAHNHPSGSLEPSNEDRTVTKRIKDSGDLVGITMLDSMIVSKYGFLSMKETGYV